MSFSDAGQTSLNNNHRLREIPYRNFKNTQNNFVIPTLARKLKLSRRRLQMARIIRRREESIYYVMLTAITVLMLLFVMGNMS